MKSKEYEEIIQKVLEYIERESEFWDEDFLLSTGLDGVCRLVQEAVCKSFFMQMHEETRLKIPGVDLWTEEDMIEDSKWFYYDCIQYYVLERSEKEDYGEIDYDEFYDIFIEFIKRVGNIRINDEMKKEFKQLIDMLTAVEFKAEDGSFDESKEKKISKRYVISKDENEIDVETQIKRFWVKWIVGKDIKDTSKRVLQLKKMKKQELIIWMLMAALYNFSDWFGDEYLCKLKSILSYTHTVEEKDISPVLSWCFRCWEGMVCYAEDMADFINEEYFYGIVSLSHRFHYVDAICKNKIRKKLTELWDMKYKNLSNDYIFTLMLKIRYSSVGEELPFIGKMKKNGGFSDDDRYAARYVKDIWKDFEVKQWLLNKNYFAENPLNVDNEVDKYHGDYKIYGDNIKNSNDFFINNFIADEFYLLATEYRKHKEYWNFHFMIEVEMFLDQLIEIMDSTNENLEEFAKSSFGNKEWSGIFYNEKDFVSNQVWGEIKRLKSLYNDLTYEAIIDLYWNMVQEIFRRGKIKVSDILCEKLFQNIQNANFELQKDGYICCEMPFDQARINLQVSLPIYCLEYEYKVQ